jgi:hypothetical protein
LRQVKKRHVRIAELQPHRQAADLLPQVGVLALNLRGGILALPLEWRVRLGGERRDRDVDLRSHTGRTTLRKDLAHQFHDGIEIGLALFRQPDHEIQLQGPPTVLEGRPGVGEHVLVRDHLVDHAAHAFGTRLGRERESRAAHLRDAPGHVDGERPGAQRRQRQGDTFRR